MDHCFIRQETNFYLWQNVKIAGTGFPRILELCHKSA
jgi:hypothetical protein